MNEKIRIANSIEALCAFLKHTVDHSGLKLVPTKLSGQIQWKIRNGVLSHNTNGFFHVAGIKRIDTDDEHLVLYQPQSAVTGLCITRYHGEAYILLQARVEPGNTNIAQYGPTIQATLANYIQMHGGKKVPYNELFLSCVPGVVPLGHSTQFDIGKRYFHKDKKHSYLELDSLINTDENMIWVSLNVITECLSKNYVLNTDLRSLLAVFDWDHYLHPQPQIRNDRQDNKAIVDQYFADNLRGQNTWRLTSLYELDGWQVRDDKIVDRCDSGIWAEMYDVACMGREMKSWSQPLLCSASKGVVDLLMRKNNGGYEYLITLGTEFGINNNKTVLPSNLFYPGETITTASYEGTAKLIMQSCQSEEGGRFYKNESTYRVYEVEEGDMKIQPNQLWVSSKELKLILKTSNRASIQLRCISSMVLKQLNPLSFSYESKLVRKEEYV